jgi:hypothetical protein
VGFQETLKEHFSGAIPEADFVNRTVALLSGSGFTPENTIACVALCRDEITQPLLEKVRATWGEAFNFSSLAGMLFLGRTGFTAAAHHAPNAEGKERYVYLAFPHIAIHTDGQVGYCRRGGRKELSTACGALFAFQKELASGRLSLGLAFDDIEQSLIKMRLIQEIPYGQVPDLLALTRAALKVIQDDLQSLIGLTVDGNYIWPDRCFQVVDRVKTALSF